MSKSNFNMDEVPSLTSPYGNLLAFESVHRYLSRNLLKSSNQQPKHKHSIDSKNAIAQGLFLRKLCNID